MTYDIADDRRRRYVTKLMESYGYRVQESVFEAFLSASDLAELKERLQKEIDEKEDSIRLYALCASCDRTVAILGTGDIIEQKQFIVL
jgi:CRISPR-associated protein Cas2